MSFHLGFSQQAQNDVEFHKKAGDKAVLKKLFVLLNELTEHPFEGTGKPEPLKYSLAGIWSRRINQEHRLIIEYIKYSFSIFISINPFYRYLCNLFNNMQDYGYCSKH